MTALQKMSCLFLLAGFTFVRGQETSGEKVSFRLNNLSEAKRFSGADQKKPDLIILSPSLENGIYYESDEEDLEIVGRATDESGVVLVSVNSKVCDMDDSGRFTVRAKLEPGQNRFKISAVDGNNNLTENYLVLEYTPPVLALEDKIMKNSVYYGVLIGIDKYMDSEINDLENPVKDCRKLYRTLVGHYFFKEENIVLLENATRADILRSFDHLARKITPEDNLLIFYAGHGWWDEFSSNGYWLPSDADRHEKTNWVRNSTIVDILQEINSRHSLVIADACFGGAIFSSRAGVSKEEYAYEKLYDLPSRKAMTSGTLTEVPDRSSFTRYLIERLEGNEQLFLSSSELYNSFRIAVINNSDAIPQYGDIENVGDQGGDFIFLKKD